MVEATLKSGMLQYLGIDLISPGEGIPTAADLKEYKALHGEGREKRKAAPLTPGEKYKKYLYKKEGMHNMNDAAKARAYRVGRL